MGLRPRTAHRPRNSNGRTKLPSPSARHISGRGPVRYRKVARRLVVRESRASLLLGACVTLNSPADVSRAQQVQLRNTGTSGNWIRKSNTSEPYRTVKMCSLVDESGVTHRVPQILGASDRAGKLPSDRSIA